MLLSRHLLTRIVNSFHGILCECWWCVWCVYSWMFLYRFRCGRCVLCKCSTRDWNIVSNSAPFSHSVQNILFFVLFWFIFIEYGCASSTGSVIVLSLTRELILVPTPSLRLLLFIKVVFPDTIYLSNEHLLAACIQQRHRQRRTMREFRTKELVEEWFILLQMSGTFGNFDFLRKKVSDLVK